MNANLEFSVPRLPASAWIIQKLFFLGDDEEMDKWFWCSEKSSELSAEQYGLKGADRKPVVTDSERKGKIEIKRERWITWNYESDSRHLQAKFEKKLEKQDLRFSEHFLPANWVRTCYYELCDLLLLFRFFQSSNVLIRVVTIPFKSLSTFGCFPWNRLISVHILELFILTTCIFQDSVPTKNGQLKKFFCFCSVQTIQNKVYRTFRWHRNILSKLVIFH